VGELELEIGGTKAESGVSCSLFRFQIWGDRIHCSHSLIRPNLSL